MKTSLAPGSRVVTEYLTKTGLQPYLDQLGFNLVGYGCTTCIGNSGPLDPQIEEIDHEARSDRGVSVLSGNRNFEARVHQSIKANFLMSPPLVVAFALAGTRRHRPDERAARHGPGRRRRLPARHLADAGGDRRAARARPSIRETYRTALRRLRRAESALERDPASTRRRLPVGRRVDLHPGAALLRRTSQLTPGTAADIKGARPLAIFGDSVTTDHISPGRRDQADLAGRAVPAASTASQSRTSTATARAAATTR